MYIRSASILCHLHVYTCGGPARTYVCTRGLTWWSNLRMLLRHWLECIFIWEQHFPSSYCRDTKQFPPCLLWVMRFVRWVWFKVPVFLHTCVLYKFVTYASCTLLQALRCELKAWEKSFVEKHGRKPGSKDIAADPDNASDKYKRYESLKVRWCPKYHTHIITSFILSHTLPLTLLMSPSVPNSIASWKHYGFRYHDDVVTFWCHCQPRSM